TSQRLGKPIMRSPGRVRVEGSQSITTLTAGKGTGGGGAVSGSIGNAGTAGGGTNGDLNITGGVSLNITALQIAGGTGLGFGPMNVRSSGSSSPGTAATGYGGAGTGGCDPAPANLQRAGAAGTAGCAVFEWYA